MIRNDMMAKPTKAPPPASSGRALDRHPPSDLMGDDRCLIYSSCNLFLSTLETPPDSFSSWRSIDRRNLAVVNLCPQAGEEKYFFGSRSNPPLTEDYSVIALV